jgi:CRP-like cAMP-binding protein
MQNLQSFFAGLSEADVAQINSAAVVQYLKKDDVVFSEGDDGECFYIIDRGRVSIFANESGRQIHISSLGAGEYFGEMSLFNNDKRSASVVASEDSTLLCLDRSKFNELIKTHPVLADKLARILAQRNENLILREQLIDITGLQSRHLYVSIKGDPSIRETALFRERYESPVDKILVPLGRNLQELLINRCVYHLVINFNSGEIHTRSVFDPYRDAIHTADKLISAAYLDRHFVEITYEEKLQLIKDVHRFILDEPQSDRLSTPWKNIYKKSHDHWQPIRQEEIIRLVSSLTELRNIPNFYLRNYTISMTQDAIRMQFNCDGTHIVSSEDYQSFIDANFRS